MSNGTWARARTAREGRDHQTRTAVIDAASHVFAEYGYARTSMAAIAEAAGVSRPTVYLYFSTKADVFRALAEQVRDEFLRAHETTGDAVGPHQLWRESTRAFLAAYRDNSGNLTVIEHQALADPQIRELWLEIHERPRRRMVNYIKQLTADGIARPVAEPEVVAEAVVGTIQHFATLLGPDDDVAERVEQLTSMHLVLLGVGSDD
ncbi:TetR/AcrR family transcriptional regulator [Gordonia sp. (in: high G+C Gram-positive bacteria)]|uniref:TetR/AcrR family transcriptional regulator n=1 Tax=Gordonia sp. (in: high G+C Gram-positive bacteria) TaxID=84139 RepID=UPI003529AB1D